MTAITPEQSAAYYANRGQQIEQDDPDIDPDDDPRLWDRDHLDDR